MHQLHFFPSRTMALYVGRLFLVRSFSILFALVLILQTLDLLGESGKILAVAGNSDSDVWRYVGMRMPQIIETFLPFSVLLGTILTMVTLNQNSEVIAMKASGMSAHQVLAPLFLAALLVAGISFAFNERIVTRSTAALSAWQKVEYKKSPQGQRHTHQHLGARRRQSDQRCDGRYQRPGDRPRLCDDLRAHRRRAVVDAVGRQRTRASGRRLGIDQCAAFPAPLGHARTARHDHRGEGCPPRPVHAGTGRRRRAALPEAPVGDRRSRGGGAAGRCAQGRAVAQDFGPAVGDIDAAARRGRGVRPRALGQALHPRDHRHGARHRLFRRRQFRARDGRSGRLLALPRRMGAVHIVCADRRDDLDPDRGIGTVSRRAVDELAARIDVNLRVDPCRAGHNEVVWGRCSDDSRGHRACHCHRNPSQRFHRIEKSKRGAGKPATLNIRPQRPAPTPQPGSSPAWASCRNSRHDIASPRAARPSGGDAPRRANDRARPAADGAARDSAGPPAPTVRAAGPAAER
eukprot:Opistho-1_new@31557